MIDDGLRKKYDEGGEEGIKNDKTVDSKLIFEMIFGSDKFESLIGELALSSMAQMQDNHPPELLEFKQKKREVTIAINLVNRMAIYQADLVANTDDLHQETLEMANDLAANPMGKLLLGKIGWIYTE